MTGTIGLTPTNNHGSNLLGVEPQVPLQTRGVDCCQILIKLFHHLRTRRRSTNNCIDRSIILVAHNMVPNNVEELRGVEYKKQRT